MAETIRIHRPAPADIPPGPLLVGAPGLAKILNFGLRTIRAMDASGHLPRPLRLGASVRWRVAEIHAWIEAGCPERDEWETRTASRQK